MEEHILIQLSRRYPQLLFPLSYDTKNSEAYRCAVRRGEPFAGTPDFSFSPKDRWMRVDTPAGCAEILLLEERKDFEHCVRALAYQCEPREIPSSMGATTISGLINWEKIHGYLDEYEANGGKNRDFAFRIFTADRKNYTDRIILLSSGWYSAVEPRTVGLSDEEWTEKSVTIRQYHELTHFICRTLYPENIDAVRDEIFADMIGIFAAFGRYDVSLAKVFLGIEGEQYRKGGRLENYLESADPNDFIAKAVRLIDWLAQKSEPYRGDVFGLLLELFGMPELKDLRMT